MKVKVISKFIDKYTNTLHLEGEILEIEARRVEEINSSLSYQFLESITESEDAPNLNKLSKKELLDFAKSKDINIDSKLTKLEIVKELNKYA